MASTFSASSYNVCKMHYVVIALWNELHLHLTPAYIVGLSDDPAGKAC